MLNMAVCDDDYNICNHIFYITNKYFPGKIDVIDDFSNGKELIDAISEGQTYNIIFLDLEMDIMDGISTGNIIRSFANHKNSIIIFITSHDANPVPIVDIHPFAYLKKPVDDTLLCEKLSEAISAFTSCDTYTTLHRKSGNYYINTSEVYFLQSIGRRCYIHFSNEHLVYSNTLGFVYNQFIKTNDFFIRVHTSYAINLKFLKRITPNDIELTNDIVIPIGRSYKTDLLNKYNELFLH